VTAAQTAAAIAPAHASPPAKLQPRPPTMVSSRQGSPSSSSGVGSATGLNWSGSPAAAPTPGLKTLRTMRRRVSEPAAACSMRTSAAAGAEPVAAAVAGGCSPVRATTGGGAAAAMKLPSYSHRLRSVSDAAEAGSSPLRQVKAVASASIAVERSVINISGMESSGNGVGAGSPAVDASSDSCALRDCAPTPG
jgi:hypothetical protein